MLETLEDRWLCSRTHLAAIPQPDTYVLPLAIFSPPASPPTAPVPLPRPVNFLVKSLRPPARKTPLALPMATPFAGNRASVALSESTPRGLIDAACLDAACLTVMLQ